MRQQGLRASTAFSQAKFEDAEKKVAVAVAKVKRAEANILIKKAATARKRLDVEYAYVKAPYAGVVLQRFTENGSYVRVGDPLVKMISDQALEIEADVPSTRIGGLSPERKVGFELDDGSRHQAAVRAVLPSENPLTRTRTVRFVPKFADTDLHLAEGQSVTIAIPVGVVRDVVTVHKDAVLRRQGRDTVYVITNGTAELRTIAIGESVGSRFEVLQGLKAGEAVVVRGNERLLPGAKVRVEKGSS
jgi:RND family efflux transporter MFP subunit